MTLLPKTVCLTFRVFVAAFGMTAPCTVGRGRSAAAAALLAVGITSFFPTAMHAQSVVAETPIITEFMAANAMTLEDEDGDYSDWIEIYNPTDASVNLEGWALTDDRSDPLEWTFPPAVVQPDEYLIVFASGKDRRPEAEDETASEGELHASFRLDRDGEYLALLSPAGDVTSEYDPFPAQRTDVSYGLTDDGAGGLAPTFFEMPTPGSPNESGRTEFVDPPTFSAAHGTYENPFSLFLFPGTAGSVIRYTTDGSTPTDENGSVYTAPLLIDETTVIRAAGFKPGAYPSDAITRTYLFLDDVIRQSSNGRPPDGWPASWGQNDVDYGMDPDIIGGNEHAVIAALRAVPSVSIAMEIDSLFHPQHGIYANALQYGREWERPASVELLYPSGFQQPPGAPAYHGNFNGFQVNAGVRIRGGWSRNADNPKHAFRVFFRGMYGPTMLSYDLFGDEGTDRFDKIDFRTAQNYSWSYLGDPRNTFVRDVFARDTQRDMAVLYTRSRYYHLYLNGQYWGLFQSQERADGPHGAAYMGGDGDDFDVIKSAGLDGNYEMEVTAGNVDAWRQLWEVANELAADPDPNRRDELFLRLQGLDEDGTRHPDWPVLLDVDNLINYMLVIFWTGNPDAPITPFMGTNNFFAIRDRTADRGFVYFAHDSEHTLLPENGGFRDRTGPFPAGSEFRFSNPQWIHQQLMGSREYRMRFADLARRHLLDGGAMTADRAIERWNARADEVESVILAESARWGDSKTSPPRTTDDWATEIDRVRTAVLPNRAGVVVDQLKRAQRYRDGRPGSALIDAPLYPAVDAPEFSRYGGEVDPDFRLELTGPEEATIYYTLDGTDPRHVGGEVAEAASIYDGTPLRPAGRVSAMARAKIGDEWSALTQAEFFVDTARPSASMPALSEIYYHPSPVTQDEEAAGFTSGEAFEFLELHNTSASKSLDLGGLSFIDGIELTFGPSVLAPDEYAVVVGDSAAFRHRYGPDPRVLGRYEGRLDNAGETITLADRDGSIIHSFAYEDGGSWPSRADGAGSSLELIDPTSDYDRGRSWRAESEYGGSPGRAASAGDPDVVVNEVLTHTDDPLRDAVELHNRSGAAIDVGGWLLSDSREVRKYVIPDGTVIESGAYLVFDEGDFNASGTEADFAFSAARGDEVWLVETDASGEPLRFADHVRFGAARNGESFGRWPDATGELYPMLERTLGATNSGPRTGSVILREIMYHPPGNNPNLEYLVLSNAGNTAENLAGWELRDGVEYAFDESDAELAPGDSVVVVAFDPVLEAERAATFKAAFGWPEHLPLRGGWKGRLANEGEVVTLTRPDEPPPDDPDFIPHPIEDRIAYDEESPWPGEADGEGASLLRVDASIVGDNASGWRAHFRPFEVYSGHENPEPPPIPASGYVLSSAYPNPAGLRAVVTLAVRERQQVRATLYDALGRRVRLVYAGSIEADRLVEIAVDGSDLASGLYFLRVVGGSFADARTVTFIR